MRLVPVLFPCDLGSTEQGRYVPGGERGAPDLLLDLLEDEGVRLSKPRLVAVETPSAADPVDAPLKLDAPLARAISALAAEVAAVNKDGDFPLVLGGDQTGMCGHVLGHSARHSKGIGLAVLGDAFLDLATPAPPVYDDRERAKSPDVTATGDMWNMVLAASLRMFPKGSAVAEVMAKSAVSSKQTTVLGVRGPRSAQVRATERRAGIEVWSMERLELDGEASFRSTLTRHLATGPIALSIDVTGIDPALMGAVKRPVPDGIDWSFLKRTLDQCVPHVDRLLGLDLCQVDPTKDDVHHTAMCRLVETIAPFLMRLGRV
ncbi:MAG: arginase family protein [Deltaproteobacteria bacterium]|nr:arginase family protein [Deltaproteobacteria bacterium]